MPDIFEKAKELKKLLEESDEYKDYIKARETALSDIVNQRLIRSYKALQNEIQREMMANESVDPEKEKRLKEIMYICYDNADIADYLMKEMAYQSLISKTIKIITQSSGVNDMLELD